MHFQLKWSLNASVEANQCCNKSDIYHELWSISDLQWVLFSPLITSSESCASVRKVSQLIRIEWSGLTWVTFAHMTYMWAPARRLCTVRQWQHERKTTQSSCMGLLVKAVTLQLSAKALCDCRAKPGKQLSVADRHRLHGEDPSLSNDPEYR